MTGEHNWPPGAADAWLAEQIRMAVHRGRREAAREIVAAAAASPDDIGAAYRMAVTITEEPWSG